MNTCFFKDKLNTLDLEQKLMLNGVKWDSLCAVHGFKKGQTTKATCGCVTGSSACVRVPDIFN